MANELKYHMNMLNSIDKKVGGPGNWVYIIDALNSIDQGLTSYIPDQKQEIEDFVEQVIASIPSDYTTLEQATYNAYPTESESGNPIYFDDGAKDIPVKELIVNLEPKQSGSGDPSPSNVRPITGYNGVTVNVNDEEYSITFPSSAGTVYGGRLNVTTGKLTVDRYNLWLDPTKIPDGYIHFDVLTNNVRVGNLILGAHFGLTSAYSAKYSSEATFRNGALSNWSVEKNKGYSSDTSGFYFSAADRFYLFCPKSIFATQDASGFKQYFTEHPLYICYELETPQTYQLTPTEVRTLLGSNTFSSNGTTIDLTYRADATLASGTYGVVHFTYGDPSTADMTYESAVSMHLSGKPLTAYVTVGNMTAVSKEYVYTGSTFVFGISITGVASGTVVWNASGVQINVE